MHDDVVDPWLFTRFCIFLVGSCVVSCDVMVVGNIIIETSVFRYERYLSTSVFTFVSDISTCYPNNRCKSFAPVVWVASAEVCVHTLKIKHLVSRACCFSPYW